MARPPSTGGHFSNIKVCHSGQNLPTWTSPSHLASIPFLTPLANSAPEFWLGLGQWAKVQVYSELQGGEAKMQEERVRIPVCPEARIFLPLPPGVPSAEDHKD